MKRIPLFIAMSVSTIIALAPAAVAQSFPTRPVRLVIPFSPGTAADIVARQLGSRLADMWGQAGMALT